MTPIFCPFHQHWTDGPCQAGKQSLDRLTILRRLNDIDAMLGDDEGAQARGYYANKALEIERNHLTDLKAVLR